MTLRGRTAVVTGGGRGIGASVAERLARAGAIVIVASRTPADVQAVAERLTSEGLVADWAVCDVADPASIERLAATASSKHGRVDILINNAGVASAASIQKTTLDEWTRTMTINATGAFLCLKAFLPGMIDAGWGRVVNVASTAGLSADRYISAYAASKHAMVGLTRAAAAEVAGCGVTVNAVCPGYVDTDMTRETVARIMAATGRTEQQALDAILSISPQHRLIEPDEVAETVLFLCGEGARGVNGAAIVIDGGELRQ